MLWGLAFMLTNTSKSAVGSELHLRMSSIQLVLSVPALEFHSRPSSIHLVSLVPVLEPNVQCSPSSLWAAVQYSSFELLAKKAKQKINYKERLKLVSKEGRCPPLPALVPSQEWPATPTYSRDLFLKLRWNYLHCHLENVGLFHNQNWQCQNLGRIRTQLHLGIHFICPQLRLEQVLWFCDGPWSHSISGPTSSLEFKASWPCVTVSNRPCHSWNWRGGSCGFQLQFQGPVRTVPEWWGR